MLDPNKIYNRKKQVLYDSEGIPVLKFKEITTDATKITGVLVENMNNYIKCYPDRIEIIKQKLNNQLTFF